MMDVRLFLLLFVVSVSSCWSGASFIPIESQDQIFGLKPVYFQGDIHNIYSTDPIAFAELGKIVSSGDYIYLTEVNKGIHIVDNTDPTKPITQSFIHIPAVSDFTVRDNYIFANNARDLVSLQLDDQFQVTQVFRTKDFYSNMDFVDQLFPSDYFGAFECVDSNRGEVLTWESALLENPKCWR